MHKHKCRDSYMPDPIYINIQEYQHMHIFKHIQPDIHGIREKLLNLQRV